MPKKNLPTTKSKVSKKPLVNKKKIVKKTTKKLTVVETKVSKISTKTGQFNPTSSMQIWVATSISLSSDNISEIAQECGIDRTSWYKWLQHPKFLEWYEKERERNLVLLRQKLDNIGIKKSKSDFQYWKAMQKIVGRDVSEEQVLPPIGTPVQVNFNANKYIKDRDK